MTSTTHPLADGAAPGRISFARIVTAEARKIINTQTGFWLVVALAVSTAGVVAARAVLTEATIGAAFATSGVILSTLLPAIGAVAMASEFGSTTAMITFAFEPRRGRVILAKCLPLIGLAVTSSGVALLVAIATATAKATHRGVAVDWSLTLTQVAGSTLIIVLLMLAGIALGLMLLNIPLALVLLLPSTMVWSIVSTASDTVARIRPWLDLGWAARPLGDLGLDGPQLARLGVAVAVNIVLPVIIGVLRVHRREVK